MLCEIKYDAALNGPIIIVVMPLTDSRRIEFAPAKSARAKLYSQRFGNNTCCHIYSILFIKVGIFCPGWARSICTCVVDAVRINNKEKCILWRLIWVLFVFLVRIYFTSLYNGYWSRVSVIKFEYIKQNIWIFKMTFKYNIIYFTISKRCKKNQDQSAPRREHHSFNTVAVKKIMNTYNILMKRNRE